MWDSDKKKKNSPDTAQGTNSRNLKSSDIVGFHSTYLVFEAKWEKSQAAHQTIMCNNDIQPSRHYIYLPFTKACGKKKAKLYPPDLAGIDQYWILFVSNWNYIYIYIISLRFVWKSVFMLICIDFMTLAVLNKQHVCLACQWIPHDWENNPF